MAKADLTVSRLREALRYDPTDGTLWKRVGNTHPSGHRNVMVDGKTYSEHRLIWFFVMGEWPKGDIDHINGDPADNRIGNLRDVSTQTNMQNERKARKNNKSGYLGVHWKEKVQKWGACISVSRKKHHLGYFDSPEAAHQAYLEAKRAMHPGCTI